MIMLLVATQKVKPICIHKTNLSKKKTMNIKKPKVQAKQKVKLLKNHYNFKHKCYGKMFTAVDSTSLAVPPDGGEICH